MVRDTILYISKPQDRTIPKAIYPKCISRRRQPDGRNGTLTVRVDRQEMDRLWK
jgi:hypothetical protein